MCTPLCIIGINLFFVENQIFNLNVRTFIFIDRDIEILNEREIKDIQNAHSMERSRLEKRDLHNSEEIETLHRKCRCLTKLYSCIIILITFY